MISMRIHDQGHYKQWIRGAPSLIPEPYPLPSEMEVKDKGEVGTQSKGGWHISLRKRACVRQQHQDVFSVCHDL